MKRKLFGRRRDLLGAGCLVLIASLSSLAVQEAAEPLPRWLEIGRGLPTSGQWRNGFDLADFDGDGRLDLAHGPARRSFGKPTIFLGRPNLEFERWAAVSLPELPYDYGDAAAADFDGDGHADLALAVHTRGLVVLLGDGHGSFAVGTSTLDGDSGSAVFSSRAVAAGDVDGDSRPDLVALGEGARFRGRAGGSYGLRVLLGRLPKDWEWRELQPGRSRLSGDATILGDFDGDGKVDLAAATNVQGQRGLVFWGVGAGEFLAGEVAAARPRSLVESLTAADFDGDGDDDLVFAFSDLEDEVERNGLDLLVSSGRRSWERRELPFDNEQGRPTAIAAGDFDGDGDPDLVATTSSGALVAFVNERGLLRPEPGLSADRAGRGCRGYHVQLADLDGDGRAEVLAGFADERCPGGGSLRGWRFAPR